MSLVNPHHDPAHAIKCGLACEVLALSGTLRLRVNGWSMLPTIWPGDTLIIQALGTADVHRGDIVCFQRDGRLFVHRVIGESGGVEIRTRGDAMPQPDPPMTHQQLLGRVSCIIWERKQIFPRRKLGGRERAVAGIVRCSDSAARLIVRMKALHRKLQSAVS
jgi:hypothetical protein